MEIETKTYFRNYVDANDNVRENYKKCRNIQTYEFVKNHMHPKYLNFKESSIKLTIFDALDKLNNFVDLSDPDMDLPNIIHAYQTAEAIRKEGLPDWLQLVGLIHDLGKMMYLKGTKSDGTTMDSQFSIVGDTFIVGYPIPSTIVYPEFNELNEDNQNGLNMYEPKCGLDNCIVSFGHDEYLFEVLKYNNSTIPEAGLNMIRYHSLYVFHTYGAYTELMSEKDYETLKDVKLFNRFDLYTKDNTKDNNILSESTKEYYKKLVEKYIGLQELIW